VRFDGRQLRLALSRRVCGAAHSLKACVTVNRSACYPIPHS
jgi:hypothetical protein